MARRYWQILLVDDEEDARALVRSMLADQVAEILSAANGREALALALSRRQATGTIEPSL